VAGGNVLNGASVVLPLKLDRAGQAETNLNASDFALFHAADQFQQFDDSVLQTEITVPDLGTRAILAAKLQFLNHFGRRIERGLALAHLQGFHAAEIHGLEQFDQLSLRGSKGRFGCLVHQALLNQGSFRSCLGWKLDSLVEPWFRAPFFRRPGNL